MNYKTILLSTNGKLKREFIFSSILSLVIIAGVCHPCIGQRTMNGQILDAAGKPVSGVEVSIQGTNVKPVTTDEQGRFAIFAALRQRIVFRKEGFRKHSFIITQDQSLTPVIELAAREVNRRLVKIQGTVVDWESGEPLIGATVRSQGSTAGTMTDIEGKFELTVDIGVTLLINYGNYDGPEEFAVKRGGHQTYLLNQPPEDPGTFGTQTKIERKDFTIGNFHNPLQLIQGRIPGAMISQAGGNDPFGNYSVRLHGLSTFDNRSPLIVIDGLPNADLSMVDPLDIQSINVIRDGTAAMYGIQGGSGVIEVTTLDNRRDNTGINYRSYLGIDQFRQTVDYLNAEEYRRTFGSHDRGSNTNWFEQITRDALSHAHHLSLNNRLGQQTSYQISANYRSAAGILNRQNFTRLQLNGHFRHSALDNKLRFAGQILVNQQEDNYSEPAAVRYAQSSNPTAPIYDEASPSGYFAPRLFDYYNPLEIINLTENIGSRKHLFTRFGISYDILPNLTLQGNYGNHQRVQERGRYVSKDTYWQSGNWYNGYAQIEQLNRDQQVFNADLNYRFFLNRAGIQLRFGHQYQIFRDQLMSASGGDFLTNAFSFHNLGAAGDFRNGRGRPETDFSGHRLSAFYGQLKATWNNWMTIDAGWRTEGSTRLGANNKWGHFPFAALQLDLYRIMDGFLSDNHLQLRGSYGITGNLPLRSGLSRLTYDEGRITLQSQEFLPSYEISIQANPELKWEEKREWTLGASMESKLGGKSINYSITYYANEIEDIIRPIRLFNDIGLTYQNIGGLSNRGIELEIDYTPVLNNALQWQTGVQISANTTILNQYYSEAEINQYENFRPFTRTFVSHSGCCKAPTVSLAAGEEIGAFWLLKHLGIDNDGRWIFADVDRDGKVDDWLDVHNAGNGLPNWTLGWSNRVSVNNFDIRVFFRGAFGHQLFNSVQKLGEAPTLLGSESNLLSSAPGSDVWRLTDFPQESSRYVQNASYLRLESLSLGYDLPTEKMKFFRKVRFYVAAQNLLTFTGYQGWDPEFRLASGDLVFAPGYEHRTDYFPTRSLVFGLELGIK